MNKKNRREGFLQCLRGPCLGGCCQACVPELMSSGGLNKDLEANLGK